MIFYFLLKFGLFVILIIAVLFALDFIRGTNFGVKDSDSKEKDNGR